MGLARLSKVTVVAPRTEFDEVAKTLARFEHFHPISDQVPKFDPAVQELAVEAVRLFASADQLVKDLDIELTPGVIDIVFRGVKIPHDEYEAASWRELLAKGDSDLKLIAEKVRNLKASLQKAVKEENDSQLLIDALHRVSGFSADISRLSSMGRLKVVLVAADEAVMNELSRSLPEAAIVTQPLGEGHNLALVYVPKSEAGNLDRVMKTLEMRPISIPSDLPQNPADAFKILTERNQKARSERALVESELLETRKEYTRTILAVREVAEVGREVLDEARASGEMGRFAVTAGYIPTKAERQFNDLFRNWMVFSEPVAHHLQSERTPTLLENPVGLKTFQLITGEQGTPGSEEVDPTPLISFVFPIFFGLMFGDVGHGIIVTLFALLIRQRGRGSLRQWGNIFLVAGLSATFFGALVGEFFGSALNLYQILSPATVHSVEILSHPAGVDAVDTGAIQNVMIISVLIGVAHLTTGLSLDVFEALRSGETVEALVGKIPTLTMYLSGVGYGIAFMGAGYSFNVLKPAGAAPLLGIPNELLGTVSLAVLLVSMLAIFSGKAVAIKLGKLHGESVGTALSNGGLEVFERISQFLSNTISYVRLAIMLLVHAVLLLIVNKYTPLTEPVTIIPWILLNCLIIAFEAFVVYVQDLRLHIYEFFTKFYRGTGTPFRKILPDRVRIGIKWL